MTESLFVNADWSALVPAGSAEAAFGITPKDAKRRGLLPLDTGETLGEPEKLLVSANLVQPEITVDAADTETVVVEGIDTEPEVEPVTEPEAKQAPKPANKAARKPRNK